MNISINVKKKINQKNKWQGFINILQYFQTMNYHNCIIQNIDQTSVQNGVQNYQFDHWVSEILNLDDSQWFSLRQPSQIQGYKNFDQDLPETLPFIDEYLNLGIDDSNSISVSLNDQKKSFQSIMKQSHQTLQNFKCSEMQKTKEQTCNQANYHRGHMDYICQSTTPIFIQSRKFCKSRRKMHRNKTYYKFVSKHMKGQESNSCKRFDQYHLQQAFKKMGAREQQVKQATLEAIRHLKKYRNNCQNKKLMEKHRRRYMQCRKWAIFLQQFVASSK